MNDLNKWAKEMNQNIEIQKKKQENSCGARKKHIGKMEEWWGDILTKTNHWPAVNEDILAKLKWSIVG